MRFSDDNGHFQYGIHQHEQIFATKWQRQFIQVIWTRSPCCTVCCAPTSIPLVIILYDCKVLMYYKWMCSKSNFSTCRLAGALIIFYIHVKVKSEDKFSILCSKVSHTCLTFKTYNVTCFWRDFKQFLPKFIY